ncbi:DinB family protein [uncultured Cyclobacterium sp.]|uniref:DinB family protein n=1 Tax=uncultured Cyclobacterium sp. TaxID=453820 RepID=UPI0030ED46F3
METTKGPKIPLPKAYPPFYKGYIDLVAEKDLKTLSLEQEQFVKNLFGNLTTEKALLSYKTNKWSFNELLGHIIDTEKIMHFRALSISRGEKSDFPGFDQDNYVKTAAFNSQSINELLDTFLLHRQLLWNFIEAIPEDQIHNIGSVDAKPMSLSALLYIIFGHMEHHISIIKKYYLSL